MKDAWYVLPLLVVEFYKVCTEKQLYIHFRYLSMDSKPYVEQVKGCLILPSSVTEFNELCTQF